MLSQHALQVVSQHALQQVSKGGGGVVVGIPACLAGFQGHTQGGSLRGSVKEGGAYSRGCLLPGGGGACSGGGCSRGVPAPGGVPALGRGGWCGLLLYSSVMPFCYGLLVWWPSD